MRSATSFECGTNMFERRTTSFERGSNTFERRVRTYVTALQAFGGEANASEMRADDCRRPAHCFSHVVLVLRRRGNSFGSVVDHCGRCVWRCGLCASVYEPGVSIVRRLAQCYDLGVHA